MKCPECKNGIMDECNVIHYRAKLRGIEFDVRDAKMAICCSCSAKTYHAKELKRWYKILDKQLDAHDPSGHASCKHREQAYDSYSADFCMRLHGRCRRKSCCNYKGFMKPTYKAFNENGEKYIRNRRKWLMLKR